MVLSNFLHSFMRSSNTGVPFRPAMVPALGLSERDKLCILDRSSIMARHFFADKSEEFINAQVNTLLHSLDIDSDFRAKGPIPGRYPELEEYWTESQGAIQPVVHNPANGWITQFNHQKSLHNDPEAWVHMFEQQHGANGWASEFQEEQSQMTSMNQINSASMAAMEQTCMLAHTLSQNSNPKFQNSKLLQFVSKMSRGELIVDDNQIKPAGVSASVDWAEEYQQEHKGAPTSWANEFVQNELSHGTNGWTNEFSGEREQHGSVDDQWVNEFSKLQVNDWAEEFGRQVGEGVSGESSVDNWVNGYDEYLNEQLAVKQRSNSSRGVYVFSDMNPYVGHPDPLKGQELFRKGLLSEAVLALEAEVIKNPEHAEGWRLLGITHAENDDDQQVLLYYNFVPESSVATYISVGIYLWFSHQSPKYCLVGFSLV